MAFCIVIREDNRLLFELIKNRLGIIYNDAYIINANNYESSIGRELSNLETTIYDNRQYEGNTYDIPLFEPYKNNWTININNICTLINEKLNSGVEVKEEIYDNTQSYKMHLLVSYTYIADREEFINNYFDFIHEEADFPIRINLMSATRMPDYYNQRKSDGVFTELLIKSSEKNFDSEELLKYLNPNQLGYLTPGFPRNSEDIFDVGIEALSQLIYTLKQLTRRDDIDSKCLVIIEGFKSSDIKELINYFDVIHILLPSKNSEESLGISDVLIDFQKELTESQKILTHYIGNND